MSNPVTKYLVMFIAFWLFGPRAWAQLLSPKEAAIDSMIMVSIESKLSVPVASQIRGAWVYQDELGERKIEFNADGKFKMNNEGAMGLYSKQKGKWYIYDRYVVLDVRSEKAPMYYISYQGKTFLLDQQNIDVIRRLILGLVTRDQLVGGMNETTIFSFLKGFEKDDQ